MQSFQVEVDSTKLTPEFFKFLGDYIKSYPFASEEFLNIQVWGYNEDSELYWLNLDNGLTYCSNDEWIVTDPKDGDEYIIQNVDDAHRLMKRLNESMQA